MSRSLSSSILQASRSAARYHAVELREQQRQERSALKQERQDYLAGRQEEADEESARVAESVHDLESILSSGLERNPAVPFERLYQKADAADLPPTLQTLTRPEKSAFVPKPPGWLSGLIPGLKRKRAAAVVAGEASYQVALEEFAHLEAERRAAVEKLEVDAVARNQEIDLLKKGIEDGDAIALKTNAEFVTKISPYPEGFPKEVRAGFVAESKQLVVDLRAPTLNDIVPEMDHFKYIKARDEIVATKKAEKARQALYSSTIAQMTLRTLHELFTVDAQCHIQIIVLNIYVVATDPATGQVVQPYIVSTRVARDEFSELQLTAVDPIFCLKRLKSAVSRSAAELIPVKPIVDINMADPRFIEEQDILSTLDTRPNLMALSPSEFESLITNLFQAMGLDTKLTQASRDGGVDCVAFDPRPVLGGKVVVQAKRYKNTVGVSAVRDLFGTMHNEGASKGILVTTSGFGKAAYTFANEKPIELITGSNLLYLLREHAGVEAKIEPPEDWKDPVLDIGD